MFVGDDADSTVLIRIELEDLISNVSLAWVDLELGLDPSPSPTTSPHETKPPAWKIAVIVAACVVGLASLLLGAWFYHRRKNIAARQIQDSAYERVSAGATGI